MAPKLTKKRSTDAKQMNLLGFLKKDEEVDDRIPCKYGEKCYQKNPDHLKKYKHMTPTTKAKNISSNAQKSEIKQTVRKRKRDSEDSDNENLEVTREEASAIIKNYFLVDMPEDFYLFWKFCKDLNENHPQNALQEAVGWQLVGPYDVLRGKIKKGETRDFLLHWRYYFDPPEFQTVIRGNDDIMMHFGYFRDEPSQLPVFVASSAVEKGCHITAVGGNLFAALYKELKTLRKDDLLKKLQAFSDEYKICLDEKTASMKAREKKVVSKTFHGAGIVVHLDKNGVGYRPLTETNANLKKILSKIAGCKTEEERDKNSDSLQEIITFVQFANDECDYGMGLELGLDLFAFGHPCFHPYVRNILSLAYDLLNRSQFGQIVGKHLEKRRKGCDLSVI